mgnify:CR=1 FL=1
MILMGIKFIQTMCGFSKISDVAYLHCSNNKPVKLHYSLDDEDSEGSLGYAYAPEGGPYDGITTLNYEEYSTTDQINDEDILINRNALDRFSRCPNLG